MTLLGNEYNEEEEHEGEDHVGISQKWQQLKDKKKKENEMAITEI